MTLPEQLYRLEQLDQQIQQTEREIVELRRRRQRNPELETIQARLASSQSEEKEASARQRALSAELSDVEAKIARDQSRLYGGKVVDPRDISSLERELEHLRTRRSGLEDEVLALMERVEDLQREVAALQEQDAAVRRRWEEEQPDLGGRAREADARLATLRADRENLAAEIDGRSLSVYSRLRTASGHAVSSVTEGVCQWCRVVIPSKDVQHARAGSLVTCTNCARILYVGR